MDDDLPERQFNYGNARANLFATKVERSTSVPTKVNVLGLLNPMSVVSLRLEDALQCALTSFEGVIAQGRDFQSSHTGKRWPLRILTEQRGFSYSNYLGKCGVYMYVDEMKPQEGCDFESKYMGIRDIGMSTAKEGIGNRFRNRSSKGNPSMWRYIHIILVPREVCSLAVELETYLLKRFWTFGNRKKEWWARAAFPDGCVFDEGAKTISPEELETSKSDDRDRWMHIHWFSHANRKL